MRSNIRIALPEQIGPPNHQLQASIYRTKACDGWGTLSKDFYQINKVNVQIFVLHKKFFERNQTTLIPTKL